MTEIERLVATEAVRRVKARYFRGVDLGDGALVRSILAADCVLDYRGCCTDPGSGRDYLPAMNVVLRGRDAWSTASLSKRRVVSVHHGHQADIEILDERQARASWAMTDRLFMPEGAPFAVMQGYGFYHETYVREVDGAPGDDGWMIATLRIERLRVEAR